MANGEAEQSQSNIYDMIGLNCRFKKRIQQMLKDLKQINNRSKKLEEDYSQMRKEVFKIKQIKLYKPVRGDVVDEMFAGYLNKAKVDVEVQRTSAGNYLFGTKKIIAKIINGKLVIRVGGGYMNAEEFIEQYGEIEVMKMMNEKAVFLGSIYPGFPVSKICPKHKEPLENSGDRGNPVKMQ